MRLISSGRSLGPLISSNGCSRCLTAPHFRTKPWKTMRADRGRRLRPKPSPRSRELLTEIHGLEHRLQDLRKKARGADPLSAARSAADVQVDLIESGLMLSRCVDVIAFQIFQEDCSLRERMRRTGCLLGIADRLHRTMTRTIGGYLACFGGKETMAIQAATEWIKRARESAPSDPAQEEIDRMVKNIIKKSGQ
jgi:hypothetical protein